MVQPPPSPFATEEMQPGSQDRDGDSGHGGLQFPDRGIHAPTRPVDGKKGGGEGRREAELMPLKSWLNLERRINKMCQARWQMLLYFYFLFLNLFVFENRVSLFNLG